MLIKKGLVLFSIFIFSTAAYAQKGLSQAVESAVDRQILSKLPTFRDGIRNLVTHRLGNVPAISKRVNSFPIVLDPTRSAFDFEKKYLTTPHERRAYVGLYSADFYLTSSPDCIKRHKFFLEEDSLEGYVNPGSGNISAIALEPSSLITPRRAQPKNFRYLLNMNILLDKEFVEKDGLRLVPGHSFDRVHGMIQSIKNKCPSCISIDEIAMALDVLDIQTWMLANDGRFPQTLTDKLESSMALKFENWMKRIVNEETKFTQGPIQALVRHLVHLRIVAKDAMTPEQVVLQVLKRLEKGGRIPGSSLARVTVEENALTQELNYVEWLRKANLLDIVVPVEHKKETLVLYLKDLQQRGYIYKQMIKIIPEFANDGVTLNVPSYSENTWQAAVSVWSKTHSNKMPRPIITGRFGLPVNFNDLTPAGKEEVLLGTYLCIKDK